MSKKTEDESPTAPAEPAAGPEIPSPKPKGLRPGATLTLSNEAHNAIGGGGVPREFGYECADAHQSEDGTVTLTLGEKVKG